MFYYINSEKNLDMNLKQQALILMKYFMNRKINVGFLPDFSFDMVWGFHKEEQCDELEHFFSSFVYYNIKDKESMRQNYEKIQVVLENAKRQCI
jgi:hypothetical protein